MKKWAIIFCFVLSLTTISAQDSNYVRQVLSELTSDKMCGRGYAYKGDSIAAHYLREQFKQMGVNPLVDNYYQNYTFSVHAIEGATLLKINGVELTPFNDYRMYAYGDRNFFPNAMVNYTNLKPSLSLNVVDLLDSAKLNKIARQNRADLFHPKYECIFVDATNYSTEDKELDKKVKTLLRVLSSANLLHCRILLAKVPELNTYSVLRAEQEAPYFFVECSASKMPKKVKKIDVQCSTRYYKDYPTQNVCAKIQGTTDTMIVFTAHYDHLGMMGDKVVFHGAHDNGSGTSAVMDLARYYKQNPGKYTMVFMLFSGEEAGLKGSAYAVKHPLIDFNKVKLLVNIDMFCGGDEGFMVVNGESEQTKPYYDKLCRLNDKWHAVSAIQHRPNVANSDHWFFSKHCPAIFIYTMGQRYGGYHAPEDDCQSCGLEHYNDLFRLITSMVED